MAPITNGRLLFNSVPAGMSDNWLTCFIPVSLLPFFHWHHSGYPEPGKTTVYDTTETIDLKTVLLNGGFLIKMLELSIDPYIRDRMRAPEAKPYSVRCEEFGVYFISS